VNVLVSATLVLPGPPTRINVERALRDNTTIPNRAIMYGEPQRLGGNNWELKFKWNEERHDTEIPRAQL